MKLLNGLNLLIVTALVLFATSMFAQDMRFQGRLTGPGPSFTPTTVATSVTFRIYTTPTGGTALWTETQVVTPAATGVFSANLGATTPLNTVDFSQTLYLGITVGTDLEMVPRYFLTSTSSAFYANNAGDSQLLDGLDSTAFAQLTGANFTGNVSTTGTFTGNGSGLINVNSSTLGGLARTGFAELTGAAFTGNVSTTGTFSGNGSGVTNVNAATLGGLARTGFAELANSVTFAGVVTASGVTTAGVVAASTFSGGNYVGNGSGLSNINAQTLAGLPVGAFALLGAGSNVFGGSIQATTITATAGFSGTLTGNVTGNVSGSAASFTGSLVGDVIGTQGATVIAPNAVTSAKILDGQIVGADLSSSINITTTGDINSTNAGITDGDLTWSATAGNAAYLQLPSEVESDEANRVPLAGALRYNSAGSTIEVWTGSAWVANLSYTNGAGLSLAGNTFSVSALGITNAMLDTDAVTTGKILDGTITAADLAGNISITTTGTFTGNGSGLTNLTGANVTGTVASATMALNATNFSGALAGDVTGTQGATVIATGAVDSNKILNGSILGADLAGNISISTTGSVGAASFSGNGGSLTGLNAANITVGSLTDAQVDNNLTLNSGALISGSAGLLISGGGANITGNVVVAGGNITGNLVGNVTGSAASFTGSLAGDVIGTQGATVISNGAVTTAKILDSAITTSKIANGAVDNNKLANNAVDSGSIVNGSIATADIGNFQVNTTNLAFNAVTSSRIQDGDVTNADLDVNSVGTNNIINGTITGTDLAGNISISTTGTFTGNGSGLTNLNGANVTGPVATASNALLLGGLARAGFAELTGATFSGNVTAPIFNGALNGNANTATTATSATSATSFTGSLSGDVTGTQGATVIAADAVTTAKILNGTITGADLNGGISITTTGNYSGVNVALNNGDATFAAGAGPTDAAFLQLPSEVVSDNTKRTPSVEGALRYNTGTDTVELWNGTAWTSGTTYNAGTGLTLTGNTFSVTNLGITNGLLANDAVTSGKILDGTISGADLAGNINVTTSGTISAGSVSATIVAASDGNFVNLTANNLTTNILNLTTLNILGNATIAGTLDVGGLSTLDSLDVTNDSTIGGTLGVTGATSLSTLGTSGLATLNSANVTNNATVGGTLGVTGATSLSTLGTSGLATLDSASVTNNATVGGTLGVTGATSLSTLGTSGLATLDSASVTNNATVGGTLGVTGSTSLSTLGTSGLATLNSASVTNNASVGGTLGVTGATSLSTLGTSGLATLESASVTNGAMVGGTLGVTGATTLSTLGTSGLATVNSASVTNNATVGGTLGVTGNTSLSTVSSSGAATLDSLGVTNGATVGGTLGVTGNATFTNDVTVNGDLDVPTGSFTFANGSITGTLSVTGNTSLSTVSSSGLATLDSLSVTNSGTVGGLLTANNGLNVTGTVNLPAGEIGNTELANSSLTVTAGTNLTGGGAVSLGGSVTLNLDPAYAGQNTITTLGTITTGVWNGSSITDGNVDNNLTIDGGTVNNTVIGGTGAAAGTFTTLASASLDTGNGANELFAMDQDVQTTDSPTFADLTVTNKLTVGGLIDPTGLQLTRVAVNPGNADTFWVNNSGVPALGADQIILNSSLTSTLSSYSTTSQMNTAISTAVGTAISGLGTMSTQNANGVAISGGSITSTSISGSTGSFTTLSATGATTINTSGGANTNVGNLTGGSVVINGGAAGITLETPNGVYANINCAPGTGTRIGDIAGSSNTIIGHASGGDVYLSSGNFIRIEAPAVNFAGTTVLNMGGNNITSVNQIIGTGNWSTSGTITAGNTLTANGEFVQSVTSIVAAGAPGTALDLSVGINEVTNASPTDQVNFATGGVNGQTVIVVNRTGGQFLTVNGLAAGSNLIPANTARKFVFAGGGWYAVE